MGVLWQGRTFFISLRSPDVVPVKDDRKLPMAPMAGELWGTSDLLVPAKMDDVSFFMPVIVWSKINEALMSFADGHLYTRKVMRWIELW